MVNLKHVGRMISNGRKVLVAYRTLPGEADSCLIVPTENLPDPWHDALIQLVESPVGQESHELAEAMARTSFPDGSIMLAALHVQGKFVKVPTDAVEMIPNFQTKIKLSELNAIIAQNMNVAIDDLAVKPDTPKTNPNVKVDEIATVSDISESKKNNDSAKTTSASVSGEPDTTVSVPTDSPESAAKFYRSQADKLAKEAAQFRRMAEELVPTKKK
jgi:hypothetical protein